MRHSRKYQKRWGTLRGTLLGTLLGTVLLATSLPASALIEHARDGEHLAVPSRWFDVQPAVVPRTLTLVIPRLLLLAAEAVDLGELRESAGHGHLVDAEREFALDAAIFTDLSPVTADETPVKLPPDQALE